MQTHIRIQPVKHYSDRWVSYNFKTSQTRFTVNWLHFDLSHKTCSYPCRIECGRAAAAFQKNKSTRLESSHSYPTRTVSSKSPAQHPPKQQREKKEKMMDVISSQLWNFLWWSRPDLGNDEWTGKTPEQSCKLRYLLGAHNPLSQR